jgi:PPM family protein phosphatase
MGDSTDRGWRVAALTCVGLRREHNEDAVVVGHDVFTGDMAAPASIGIEVDERALLAVADGLGGHEAGEVASRIVAEGLADRSGTLTDEDDLTALLHRLNSEVYEAMRADPWTAGMGTTVAGVVMDGSRLVVFHVGDSRVHVSRSGRWELVTEDDVLVPGSSILTNCFGGERRLTEIEVTTTVLPAADVEEVLLCTDGLSDLVDVTSSPPPAELGEADAVAELRDRAFEGGAHDNISVVLARRCPETGGPQPGGRSIQ